MTEPAIDTGEILEALNDKVDRDLNNMNASDSSTKTVVGWGRNFTSVNQLIAQGTTAISGTYNLGISGSNVKIGLFNCNLQTSQAGGSSMSIGSDIVSETVCVTTNNGFCASSLVWIPFVTSVKIGFPLYDGGVISPTSLTFVGYM